MRYTAAALSLSLAALLTACTSSASRDEQMEYLRNMAERGADNHAGKLSQGRSALDLEQCQSDYEQHYERGNDAPHFENYDDRVDLLEKGKDLFIESCLNGTPSPVHLARS